MTELRALVVEDEPIFRMDLAIRLQRLGFSDVVETAYAEESVTLARAGEYQLILMDIRLKGEMTGLEAAEQIAGASGTPIIVMSAYQVNEEELRSRVPSLVGFIPKPIPDAALEAAAGRVLSE